MKKVLRALLIGLSLSLCGEQTTRKIWRKES